MADKQQILGARGARPGEGPREPGVRRPAGPGGAAVDAAAGALDSAPSGLEREFEPVLDIHIGIISSSLGGHGSDACAPPARRTQAVEQRQGAPPGRATADRTPAATVVATYQNKGFLALGSDADRSSQPGG